MLKWKLHIYIFVLHHSFTFEINVKSVALNKSLAEASFDCVESSVIL